MELVPWPAYTEEDAIASLHTEGPSTGAEQSGGVRRLVARMMGSSAENLVSLCVGVYESVHEGEN